MSSYASNRRPVFDPADQAELCVSEVAGFVTAMLFVVVFGSTILLAILK